VIVGTLPKSDPEPEALALLHGALSFVDEGPKDAPALMALHGIPGSIADFRYLAPQLSSFVRFVRVDLPGFGRSAPIPAAIRSYEGRFSALLELADHLGLPTFGLLGHSMGGGTALAMAARHKDRVGALVLLASVGLRVHRGLGLPPAALRLIARALRLPLLSRPLTREIHRRYTRMGFPGTFDSKSLARHLEAIGATRFSDLRASTRSPLPPTLVCFARDDHLVEQAISEELVRAIPGARALVFDEGGHNLQKTRAPELGKALGAWLKELRGTGAL
jgi:pimeloyl-ACP methyl ester carboxylesterase